MEKLLTVVIPAYNMEALLPRCLDSICVENVMGRVQVLVVNDGSKDRTLEIAKSYETRYPHYFTVIDKDNGNYGSCMNVGLAQAQGKYFRTLDADDWYDSQAYEQFVNELEKTNADMLICERNEIFENNVDYKRFDEFVKTDATIDIDSYLWENKSIKGMIHVSSIAYKTKLVRDSGLMWDTGVFFTDNEFVYWPLMLIKNIRFFRIPVYQYDRARDGQSTSAQNLRKAFHSYDVVTNRVVDKYLSESDINSAVYPIQKGILIGSLLRQVYMTLFLDGYLHKKEIDVIERKVRQNKELYNITNIFDDYRGFHYVDAYRHNKLKFWLIRLDYMIRTSKILRKLFVRL